MPAITIVGVGLGGCASLTSCAVNAVSRSQVLFGAQRLLDVFPQFDGQVVPLGGRLTEAIDAIRELAFEHDVCLLASGDPLFFGIAGLVISKLGRDDLRVIPNVSSMQLAFAAVGVPWAKAGLFSVHGRDLNGLAVRLEEVAVAGILTDGEHHPGRIAAHLKEFLGERLEQWRPWVCENLGAPQQRVVGHSSMAALAQLNGSEFANLCVLVLERKDKDWSPPVVLGYLDEGAFAKQMPKKGLITKREVRALTLANLQLRRNSIFWDLGTASGSVAIEASRMAPDGHVLAVEVDPERVAVASENARTHGADNVQVVAGCAPEIFQELLERGRPGAVFIGGSNGAMGEMVAGAYDALLPGGRLVANAITLESVQVALAAFRSVGLDPEMTLVQISRGVKLSRYLRYEALNPIHIIAGTKPTL